MTMNAEQHGNDASGERSLGAYLHSHLIAAAAGERLFEQAAKAWKDTPHGDTLTRLTGEVGADKAALYRIADELGLAIPTYKKPFAWIGAHLASLGPLNPLHGRSGAAGHLELEALITAVTGKSLLWKTLVILSRTDPRIQQDKVAHLLDQATEQLRELENLLLETTADRFADTGT
jgi:hypothetical protein